MELKTGKCRFECFNAGKGVTAGEGAFEAPGGRQGFKAPFDQNTVLYLNAR